jgi:mono/diheme cytochrome c family protein
MKILKRALLGLFALVVLAVVGVYAVSAIRMGQTIAVSDPAPAITTDSAALARGQYLTTAIAKCVGCHGADLGGQLFIDGGPLGTFYAPNLTSGTGGVLAQRSDAELVNAIRHGLGPDGRKLAWMPSQGWVDMADDDVAAIVAYLRSVPPVNRDSPASSIGPLGRALYVVGVLPFYEAEHFVHDASRPPRPTAGVTPEYGRYLTEIGGCHGCHGPTLSGGSPPGAPPDFKPPANLTPTGIGHYSEADFVRALREGKRPDGSPIDSMMPWPLTKGMTDEDIRATFAFLKTVPAKAFGNR